MKDMETKIVLGNRTLFGWELFGRFHIFLFFATLVFVIDVTNFTEF